MELSWLEMARGVMNWVALEVKLLYKFVRWRPGSGEETATDEAFSERPKWSKDTRALKLGPEGV
jgi:hypothetical protein